MNTKVLSSHPGPGVYTVTSPDGVVTHAGASRRSAERDARALAAEHFINGRTRCSRDGEVVGVWERTPRGVRRLNP